MRSHTIEKNGRSLLTKHVGIKTADETAMYRLRKHEILNATPEQIDNWIETNVTDLASAKDALKIIAKVAILKP